MERTESSSSSLFVSLKESISATESSKTLLLPQEPLQLDTTSRCAGSKNLSIQEKSIQGDVYEIDSCSRKILLAVVVFVVVVGILAGVGIVAYFVFTSVNDPASNGKDNWGGQLGDEVNRFFLWFSVFMLVFALVIIALLIVFYYRLKKRGKRLGTQPQVLQNATTHL